MRIRPHAFLFGVLTCGLASASAGADGKQATAPDFKRDVLSVLQRQYGSAVKSGDKAIAIDASGSRRKADWAALMPASSP